MREPPPPPKVVERFVDLHAALWVVGGAAGTSIHELQGRDRGALANSWTSRPKCTPL